MQTYRFSQILTAAKCTLVLKGVNVKDLTLQKGLMGRRLTQKRHDLALNPKLSF